MGLSGPKRRTKLSSDPNNNAWSKSTEGFGHKILSAQGWKPGELLGARDAAQAEHYSAANASHIKVMLREDNLGLGAKLGKSSAETFGLSTLSSIFGRLNGKSDAELEKQQNAQRDAELRAYQTHKFGHMTFVRGGLLVGDKMEENPALIASLSYSTLKEQSNSTAVASEVLAKIDRKKRKRADDALHSENATNDADSDIASASSSNETENKKRKTKTHGAESSSAVASADNNAKKKRKAEGLQAEVIEKQSKCSKRSKSNLAEENNELVLITNDETADQIASTTDKKIARAARRAAKQARKEARALRREQRKTKGKSTRSTSLDTTTTSKGIAAIAAAPVPSVLSPGSAPFVGSRQAVRQRWIQQKRLASMDAQALNEILMLKTAIT